MSSDVPPPTEEPVDPPPPTEGQRAVRAVALGVALGAVMAFLGRRVSPGAD